MNGYVGTAVVVGIGVALYVHAKRNEVEFDRINHDYLANAKRIRELQEQLASLQAEVAALRQQRESTG